MKSKKSIHRYFLLLIVIFQLTLYLPITQIYAEETGEYLDDALILKELGIFVGSDKGFELDRPPTRIEGLVLFIRLLGKEDEALLKTKEISYFKDVAPWAVGYANYAYEQGYTKGIGNQLFGSSDTMSANQYITFLLRALGYNDSYGDFVWSQAIRKAYEIDLIDANLKTQLLQELFLRDHIAVLSMNALQSSNKDANTTLISLLISENALDASVAIKYNLIATDSYLDLWSSFVQLPNDTYDTTEVEAILERVSFFPKDYIVALINNGIILRLINNPLTQEEEYSYLEGVVPRGWEETGLTWDDVPGIGGELIMVRIGYSAQGMGHSSICLELHEIAHQLDSTVFFPYSYSAYDSDFIDIQQAEKDILFPDIAYYDYVEEYFAETVAMYYYSNATRDQLKSLAPRTYAFIRDMEDTY